MLEVISIEPDDSDSRDQFLTYSLNDYELALTELNEKSKNAPFNEFWNTTRARLYAKHGKFKLAIKEFDQLIKYVGTENNIDYLINERATTYENAGLYDKAIEDYKNALRLGYTKTIPEIYKTANIRFDFTEGYLKELADFVKEELSRD